MRMRWSLIPAVAAAAFAIGCQHVATVEPVDDGAPAPESITEKVGDLEFTYAQGPGVRLSAFGVPVLNTSLIAVVTPGWGDQYYVSGNNMTLMEDAVAEDYMGGRRVSVRHQLAEEYGSPFVATETHTLLPGNVYNVRLDFTFESDEPAILEWRTGGFNPNLVAGMPYRRVTPESTIEGIVPYEAPGATAAETTVGRRFRELTISSRLGDITIETNPDHDLIMFDYRKNHYAMDDNPMFWFGYLERRLEAFADETYEFTIQFPQELNIDVHTEGIVTAAAPVEATGTARVPNRQRDYIIPKPKQLVYTDDQMPLGSGTVVYTGANPPAGVETAVEFLLADLKDIYDIDARVVRTPAPEPPPAGAILLGEGNRHTAPARLLANNGLSVPEHDEGYALRIGDGYAAIAANTEQGLFFGVTTLVQLVGIGSDGIALRGTEIVDYPSLDFRGIHALSGRNAGDQISKAVRDLMARYKMNSFIWECQYIIWDNAPELEHPRYGMQKSDAQKVVDAAGKYFIDLIPLVQSLGHSEWIFANGHNLDIAEDPETPYAYMVTNPRTYDFIFTIYQEALDFFKPRAFHIGHDEVTMRGRFPYRSAHTGMSVTELIMLDTIRLNNWFRERGIEVFLWGDMFLYKDEAPDATFAPSLEVARQRREQLPRDMVIADWHYRPVTPDEYTSIPLWRDEGFGVVGSGWYTPANIHQLALACIQQGVRGYLQTTWAGFNFAIDNNESAWFQYWAYITAAHYAWSGDETPPHELPFVPKDEFINTWFRTRPLLETKSGFHVDLTNAFNRSLVDTDGTEWLGYGPQNDFRHVPQGDHLLGETTFRLARAADGRGAILLTGMMNPDGKFPEGVDLALSGEKAAEFRMLMTTSFPTREHAEVGRIELVYTDGTTAAMPLEYGRNIFAFGEHRSGPNARIAWEGASDAGTTLRLWDVAMTNPNPAKPIASLRLVSSGTEAAPIILAITGVR